MFQQFIQNLNANTGGTVSYESSKEGAAVHVGILNSVRRHRNFKIINYSSYGSRTTTAPRRPAMRYRHSFDIPTPAGGRITVGMPYGYPYAPLRPLPANPNLRTIWSADNGHPVLQISSNTLWLCFNIETANNPVETLKAIYHAFVRPEGVQFGAGSMLIFENATLGIPPNATPEAIAAAAAAPAARPATVRRPAVDEGKGRDWDEIRHTVIVPAESDLTTVSVEIQKQRRTTIETNIRAADRDRITAATTYQNAQRAFNEAYEKMKQAEALVEERKRAAKLMEENKEDDGFMVIREVLANFYEKIWIGQPPNDLYGAKKIYALTKPVVIKHGDDIKDNFSCLAGQFVVSMGLNGENPNYTRADKRFAKHNGYEIHAPHNQNGNICWGVYRDTMHTLFVQRDYAQILLLVYRHLTNCENHYINLREYAQKLRLPYTEDPTIDLLKAEMEKEAAAEAARLAAAQAEAERATAERLAAEARRNATPVVQPVQIPGRPAVVQPTAPQRGIEVADVTPEELAQFFQMNRVAIPEQLANATLEETLNLENV